MGAEGTIVVLGDFNHPHTSWNFSPETRLLMPCSSVPFYDEILFQVNGVLNSMERILDLVCLEDPSIASLFRICPMCS